MKGSEAVDAIHIFTVPNICYVIVWHKMIF